ncbi:U-scoloptoxin(11)-Ssd2a-like [Gigantopelta aegis]|uniref:U-scoloptoxin(11)-Ssd2a-like n=1 Tax=Gigantopelta aegis TaxID=1735272 RepID=UPI001B88E5B5|nr:U-scoloptoxin(11)-Ssd2a-like [Gigantopelta aegis]
MDMTIACYVFVAILLNGGCYSETNKVLPACKSTRHVCTSIMKYPDGLEANEGPYCTCTTGEKCSENWMGNDGRAFTWQHYERAHWEVQYMFCTSQTPDNLCNHNEMAAVIETETSAWRPYLAAPRCRCSQNRYMLQGWEKKDGVWRYYYFCDQDECHGPNRPCAKIDLDFSNAEDQVKQVELLCACPKYYMCAARVTDQDVANATANNMDSITRMCEPTKKHHSNDK